MSHYDNRAVRIRALSVPMDRWEFREVGLMLQGFESYGVSVYTRWDLENAGIHISTLRNGRQYIDSVEA